MGWALRWDEGWDENEYMKRKDMRCESWDGMQDSEGGRDMRGDGIRGGGEERFKDPGGRM